MVAGTAGAGSVPNPGPGSLVEVGKILRLQLSSYNLHLWAAAVLLEQESSPSCWQRGVGLCHRASAGGPREKGEGDGASRAVATAAPAPEQTPSFPCRKGSVSPHNRTECWAADMNY